MHSDGDAKTEVSSLVDESDTNGGDEGKTSLPKTEQSTKSDNDNNNNLNKLLIDGCKLVSLDSSGTNANANANDARNNDKERTNQNSVLPYISFDRVLSHPSTLSDEDKNALDVESNILLNKCTITEPSSSSPSLGLNKDTEKQHSGNEGNSNVLKRIRSMSTQLCSGKYIDI